MAEQSNESTIAKLLKDLQSDVVFNRNDAIKTIVKNKINDQRIIDALLQATKSDISRSVRNFARSALDTFGVEHSEVEKDEPVVILTKSKDEKTPEQTNAFENETGSNDFPTRYSQQIMGFIGWYLIATVLSSGAAFGLITTPVTVIFLIVFARSKESKGVAGGILAAVGLNFFVALVKGLSLNAWCLIPFYNNTY